MISLGLIFKWINVAIVFGYIIYHVIFKIVPQVRKNLHDRTHKRLERLAAAESFKQQRLAVNSSAERQQLVIEQLTAKIAQWHTYDREVKKKLQTIHSKIYHDAKKRIERQTNLLNQHTEVSLYADRLFDTTRQELLALMNKQEQAKYANALITRLGKESHGL